MSSAIVILNYNDSETTIKLVKMVSEYNIPDHIVVVDNCSTDDSFSELSEFISTCNPGKISLIQSPENGGYAKGNNFGLRYAIKEYGPDVLFVANPDVCVTEDTFVKLADAMRQSISLKGGKIGILAPIVNQKANVWKLPGFIGMVESLFMVWFTIDKNRIKKQLVNSPKDIEEVGVVEGSFFCISREAYEAVNGFDENTFLYVEENIMGRRLKNAGYTEAVLTKERYDHFHSVSIKKRYKSSKARAFHNFYDSMTYYNKEYLKTGPVRNGLFCICYAAAYVERVIYDIVKRIRH